MEGFKASTYTYHKLQHLEGMNIIMTSKNNRRECRGAAGVGWGEKAGVGRGGGRREGRGVNFLYKHARIQ